MNKCLGCGAVLQSEFKLKEGYIDIKNIDKSSLCERCFRIRNYGDYKLVTKDNNDFVKILKEIDKTNDLVVLVVDIFDINNSINNIRKYLNNDILLVITKRDILPKVINNNKILNYFDKFNLNIVDSLIISSNKNYNFDMLFGKIKKYKRTNNVYIVGFTNAGKSSMINKIIKNYSNEEYNLTTSILPSTTLNTISIKVDDSLTLIDTPGLLDNGNIINYIDVKTIKKIIPKNGIKPITYQIKVASIIIIDELVRIEVNNNNLTFYISNTLPINRYYKNNDKLINLKKHELNVNNNEDIVISGLGFIKCNKKGKIAIYTLDNVDVYTRESLI